MSELLKVDLIFISPFHFYFIFSFIFKLRLGLEGQDHAVIQQVTSDNMVTSHIMHERI